MKKGVRGIEFVQSPEDIIRHVPQLMSARGIENWKGLWNPHAGWVHAHKALRKLGDEVCIIL